MSRWAAALLPQAQPQRRTDTGRQGWGLCSPAQFTEQGVHLGGPAGSALSRPWLGWGTGWHQGTRGLARFSEGRPWASPPSSLPERTGFMRKQGVRKKVGDRLWLLLVSSPLWYLGRRHNLWGCRSHRGDTAPRMSPPLTGTDACYRLNRVPPSKNLPMKSWPLVLQNVTLFENRSHCRCN